MSRFEELYRLPANLYTRGCPVIVEAAVLQKDNQTGKIFAQIKFKNVSLKSIIAIKISLSTYEVNGSILEDSIAFSYLDLNVKYSDYIGAKTPIYLNDTNARKFTVNIIEICCSDGYIWSNSKEQLEQMVEAQTLNDYLGSKKLCKIYNEEIGMSAKYVAEVRDELCICACGTINSSKVEKCSNCGIEYKLLKEKLDIAFLENRYEEKQNKKLEQEKIQKEKSEKTKANIKKILLVCLVFIVVISCVLGGLSLYKSICYSNGVKAENNLDYDVAVTYFSKVINYKDSATHILSCKKSKADLLVQEGNYSDAYLLYEEVSNEIDVEDAIRKCEYEQAISYYSEEQFQDALNVFTTFDSEYEEVEDYIFNSRCELFLICIRNEEYEKADEILNEFTYQEIRDSVGEYFVSKNSEEVLELITKFYVFYFAQDDESTHNYYYFKDYIIATSNFGDLEEQIYNKALFYANSDYYKSLDYYHNLISEEYKSNIEEIWCQMLKDNFKELDTKTVDSILGNLDCDDKDILSDLNKIRDEIDNQKIYLSSIVRYEEFKPYFNYLSQSQQEYWLESYESYNKIKGAWKHQISIKNTVVTYYYIDDSGIYHYADYDSRCERSYNDCYIGNDSWELFTYVDGKLVIYDSYSVNETSAKISVSQLPNVFDNVVK